MLTKQSKILISLVLALTIVSVAGLLLFKQNPTFTNVNSDKAQKLIKAGIKVVDVRQPEEYAAGHVPGAELVPLGTILEASKKWDKKQPILLVCRSGHRSRQAAEILIKEGFTAVYNLDGGILAWSGALAR